MSKRPRNRLGATGKFPQGKLNPKDEGELRLAIAVDSENRKVLIHFGGPVVWIGFDKEKALQFGQMILDKANLLP